MADVKFLFDNQLIAAVESLIKDSKNKLILISPFIDLDKRIQDALREKLYKYDFELFVLFGKNENNLYKSIKRDSLEFLMQFPNIEIRYNERLHAKFYQNDYDFIMTSLNLYDYSLAKNIEVGIIGNFASKGIIGKVVGGTDKLITQGVDKIGQGVFGLDQEVNPIQKFQTIFFDSELKYKTEPRIVEQNGFKGVFGGKKLNGFDVLINTFSDTYKYHQIVEKETAEPETLKQEIRSVTNKKTFSASQLSKTLGVSQSEITNVMQQSGLINGNKITPEGLSKGLLIKSYMGNDYIAYPDDLEELKKLK